MISLHRNSLTWFSVWSKKESFSSLPQCRAILDFSLTVRKGWLVQRRKAKGTPCPNLENGLISDSMQGFSNLPRNV
ncbi:MAG TPA: hypothetical protein DCR17_06975 [Verrucomicrobiales bacterium]|jgi:hypothetical protein|nr:hypothetical protein [Pedosphaera sp.]HAO66411.1 hypothetical protein [Verrucomicrobiales bacterium]HAR00376.1 hypothetical protein [Verrucomicrobiales bacterium]HAW02185.1 hypothetical protein [Verrucomicrobiales bacterium]HBP57126.1 hypothetical protein [Verrucomicrobiales bacterium]|tara:strand:- start:129 stop:356 length:228 start_codon:yes stop_codon:yes gene_type:complete